MNQTETRSHPLTRRGSKVEAARILRDAGWSNEEIASATASTLTDVTRWITDSTYEARPRLNHHPCYGCGSLTAPLRTNGLCEPCTHAKHEAIQAMIDSGLSHGEISRTTGIPRGSIGSMMSRLRPHAAHRIGGSQPMTTKKTETETETTKTEQQTTTVRPLTNIAITADEPTSTETTVTTTETTESK